MVQEKLERFRMLGVTMLTLLGIAGHQPAAGAEPTPPPEWIRNLIIYELNPRGYTSPNGAGDGNGSGTFASLAARLPYLEDLGITGIWMTGHSLSTNHFFNIWSAYACSRPDVLDPALGTPDQFRALVAEAHRRGIKIMLEVVMHGLVADSPLIAEHPGWFKGGSWNMVDYDYNNPEFVEWWIDVWTKYVLDYGIDGYRLDGPNGKVVSFGRNYWENTYKVLSPWNEITRRCADAGHPIVIMPELERYHLMQWENRGLIKNMYAAWTDSREFESYPAFSAVQVSSHDDAYHVKGSRANFGYSAFFGCFIPIFFGGEEFDAEFVPLPNLEAGLYGGGGPGRWPYGAWIQWDQLEQPGKKTMLADVKKMIRIKNENADLLHYNRVETNILAVTQNPPASLVPFVRFLPGEKAIVVAANETEEAMNATLTVPLDTMKLGGRGRYRITDLWDGTARVLSEDQVRSFTVTVPPDRTPGGGISLYKIEAQ